MQQIAASLEASSSQSNRAAIQQAAPRRAYPRQSNSSALPSVTILQIAPTVEMRRRRIEESRRSKPNNDNLLDISVRGRKFFNKGAKQ
jgi:hypothetical protein